jgi:trk system potassium uptake protein TrkH
MILSAYGYPFVESAFEFASSIGTVGLSVGITSAQTPEGVLWIQIFGMLLGRLEFFAIIVGLIKLIRDLHAMISSKQIA